MKKLYLYWDSNIFIDCIKKTNQFLMDAYNKKQLTIVSSSVAKMEVLYIEKNNGKLNHQDKQDIIDFFKSSKFYLHPFLTTTAEIAFEIKWSNDSWHKKDLMHLSSAVEFTKNANLKELIFWTTDADFLNHKEFEFCGVKICFRSPDYIFGEENKSIGLVYDINNKLAS